MQKLQLISLNEIGFDKNRKIDFEILKHYTDDDGTVTYIISLSGNKYVIQFQFLTKDNKTYYLKIDFNLGDDVTADFNITNLNQMYSIMFIVTKLAFEVLRSTKLNGYVIGLDLEIATEEGKSEVRRLKLYYPYITTGFGSEGFESIRNSSVTVNNGVAKIKFDFKPKKLPIV